MMMESRCLAADEYASTLCDTGQPERGAKMMHMVQGAHAEIRGGSYFSQTWRITVGRKTNNSHSGSLPEDENPPIAS